MTVEQTTGNILTRPDIRNQQLFVTTHSWTGPPTTASHLFVLILWSFVIVLHLNVVILCHCSHLFVFVDVFLSLCGQFVCHGSRFFVSLVIFHLFVVVFVCLWLFFLTLSCGYLCLCRCFNLSAAFYVCLWLVSIFFRSFLIFFFF